MMKIFDDKRLQITFYDRFNKEIKTMRLLNRN